MAFVTEVTQDHLVTLDPIEGDVGIVINGYTVAILDGDSGKLILVTLSKEKQARIPGVVFTKDGEIETV